MDKIKRSVLPMLAPAFNALLNIGEGFFGRSPKSSTVSPGAIRAMKVVQANRKAHRERLGEDGADPVFTRQQRRANERALEKQMRETPAQAARMRMEARNHEREKARRRKADAARLATL